MPQNIGRVKGGFVMSKISTTGSDIGRSASAKTDSAGTSGKSAGFDVHKQVMRSNEQAATSRAYDPDDMSRIYQEMNDGDGEEAADVARNGGLSQRSLKQDAQETSSEMNVRRKKPGQAAGEQDGEKTKQSQASRHIQRKDGDLSSSEKISAANRVGRTETVNMAQRQEALIARLVTQPNDYRGLSAANTETTFDAAQSIERMFKGAGLWVRTVDTASASMSDQINNSIRVEA